jgi:hypothetical protein
LQSNTKFVEYPRAGEARIAWAVSPLLEWGQQQEPTERLSESGSNLLPFGTGGLSNDRRYSFNTLFKTGRNSGANI